MNQKSHLEKFRNKKVHTSNLVNEVTLRATADYTSALSIVNIAKISDLVVFP